MLSLAQFILIAVVAATPALVISLANHENLGEPENGNALRASVSISIAGGLLAIFGYWLGRWMSGLIAEDMFWLIDTLWFVVGLKMIFTSFRMHPRDRSIDLSSFRNTILASVATGIDSLLIAMALGIIHEEINLFVVYVTGLMLLFSISGFKILSSSETLTKHSQRFLLLSGGLMMFLALFIF